MNLRLTTLCPTMKMIPLRSKTTPTVLRSLIKLIFPDKLALRKLSPIDVSEISSSDSNKRSSEDITNWSALAAPSRGLGTH